jgi:hypothetical protein
MRPPSPGCAGSPRRRQGRDWWSGNQTPQWRRGAQDATRDGTRDATATWSGRDVGRDDGRRTRSAAAFARRRPGAQCSRSALARQRSAKRRSRSERSAEILALRAKAEPVGTGERQRWVARSAGWPGRSRAVGEGATARRGPRTDPDTSPGGPKGVPESWKGSAAEVGPRASGRERETVTKGAACERVPRSPPSERRVATIGAGNPRRTCFFRPHTGEECRGGESPPRPGQGPVDAKARLSRANSRGRLGQVSRNAADAGAGRPAQRQGPPAA